MYLTNVCYFSSDSQTLSVFCVLFLAAVTSKWIYLCTVDATDTHSATDTAEEVDQSGLTTFTAPVLSRSWLAVVTTAGAEMTVHIMKTFPFAAWITLPPLPRRLPLPVPPLWAPLQPSQVLLLRQVTVTNKLHSLTYWGYHFRIR